MKSLQTFYLSNTQCCLYINILTSHYYHSSVSAVLCINLWFCPHSSLQLTCISTFSAFCLSQFRDAFYHIYAASRGVPLQLHSVILLPGFPFTLSMFMIKPRFVTFPVILLTCISYHIDFLLSSSILYPYFTVHRYVKLDNKIIISYTYIRTCDVIIEVSLKF